MQEARACCRPAAPGYAALKQSVETQPAKTTTLHVIPTRPSTTALRSQTPYGSVLERRVLIHVEVVQRVEHSRRMDRRPSRCTPAILPERGTQTNQRPAACLKCSTSQLMNGRQPTSPESLSNWAIIKFRRGPHTIDLWTIPRRIVGQHRHPDTSGSSTEEPCGSRTGDYRTASDKEQQSKEAVIERRRHNKCW